MPINSVLIPSYRLDLAMILKTRAFEDLPLPQLALILTEFQLNRRKIHEQPFNHHYGTSIN